ncbi:MAG: hypothetical protein EPO48_09685, partial [Nevskiaceae bacterium]
MPQNFAPQGLLPMLALGLVACAAAEPPSAAGLGPGAAQLPVSEAYQIRLQRGACFGRCPQYSLLIRDGEAEFSGERFVAVLETAKGPADAAALERLLALLRSPAVSRLKDIYRPGLPGCGAVATDMPSSRIDWTLDGQTHQLTLYHGCQGAPAELRA